MSQEPLRIACLESLSCPADISALANSTRLPYVLLAFAGRAHLKAQGTSQYKAVSLTSEVTQAGQGPQSGSWSLCFFSSRMSFAAPTVSLSFSASY